MFDEHSLHLIQNKSVVNWILSTNRFLTNVLANYYPKVLQTPLLTCIAMLKRNPLFNQFEVAILLLCWL